MQRLFFYWINYTLLILFIVMVILGVVQLAVKKESEITFYTTFFGIIFGISFMSAYYANKKSNRMFFLLTTFLLMYVPKKIVDYLNVPLLKISVANYFIVLFGILILIFSQKYIKKQT